MTAGSANSIQPLGLDLLDEADSFLTDLSPEDQAAISGGRRLWRTRSRISPPTRFSRRSRRPSPSDRFGGRRAGRGGRRRGSLA